MREAKTSKKRDEAVGRLEGSWDDLRAMGRVMSRRDKEFFEGSRRINDTNDPRAIPDRRLFSAVWTQTTSALHALSMRVLNRVSVTTFGAPSLD